VWDAQVAPSVVKAIRNKGFQVQEQSTNVRVIIPEMSEEQRKKMVKMVRDYAEEVRIALRNTRRRFIDAMDKEKNTVSEDDMYAAKKDVQTIMDKAIKNVDALLEAKEKEILA
jgi:ribosome recycling factor